MSACSWGPVCGDCLHESRASYCADSEPPGAHVSKQGGLCPRRLSSGRPAGASPVQFWAMGTLEGFFYAGMQGGYAALRRQKRGVPVPRVRTGEPSIAEVLYPPLHLEHVGGREPFEPVA